MLKTLDRDIYENEVKQSAHPALLCFFQNTICQGETIGAIDTLSRQFQGIHFYAAQEESLGFFFGKFQFLGTPVLIFFANGGERERLLGSVPIGRIRAWILKNIVDLS